MNYQQWPILFLASFFFFTACQQSQTEHEQVSATEIKKQLESVNRQLIKNEDEEIEAYIKRHHLQTTKTGTGLRYLILKNTNDTPITDQTIVYIKYTCKLINGKTCYSSDTDGVKEIKMGKTQIEAGLYEGLKLLKKGEQAIFILPSHLAWGLPGDGNQIPKRATLIYHIEIENIIKQ